MTPVRVLNLVTNDEARFFKQQLDVLERRGVDGTTLAVPGKNRVTNESVTSRSVTDYLRFCPTVLRRSFDSYDLLHANYGLTAPHALAQPNLPVVLSLWGSDLLGRYGPVSRWCARWVDAVIVMSERMADALDVDSYVIPHGVDLDRFRPRPQREAREAVGWRHDAEHVLFPYPTQRDVKDYPRAERVVERVRDRLDADVELQTLHGVPHDEMPAYVNAADVLLLTSKREGSPNSVKEALACNLPVVATDVGDVRERLDGVEHSCVRETDRGLVEGVVDALERGRASNGREAAREVSLERMGERIEDVYASVLDAHR